MPDDPNLDQLAAMVEAALKEVAKMAGSRSLSYEQFMQLCEKIVTRRLDDEEMRNLVLSEFRGRMTRGRWEQFQLTLH